MRGLASQFSRRMRRATEDGLACAHQCEATIAYGLRRHGPLAQGHHLHMLLDCADIVGVAAKILLRGGSHSHLWKAAADAAHEAAGSCEQFEDDERMMACAEACRRCEAAFSALLS